MARFKGFSTINRYKKFTLIDNELIKRDLLNALSIREGELPGRPSFGTRLWNFIFEPNTPDIVRQITAELERTMTYDPRIRIEDVIVTTDPEGVILELVVAFVPDLNPQVLQIKFDEESQTAQYL
jgi:phage baseplate assembly protein W